MGAGSCKPRQYKQKPYQPDIEKQYWLEKQTNCTLSVIEPYIFDELNPQRLTSDMGQEDKIGWSDGKECEVGSSSYLIDQISRENALRQSRANTISTPFDQNQFGKNGPHKLVIPRKQPASIMADTESLTASQISVGEIKKISSSTLECSQSFLMGPMDRERIPSQPMSSQMEDQEKRTASPMLSIAGQHPRISIEPYSDTQETHIVNAVLQNSYKPFPCVLDISSSRLNASVGEGVIWSPSKTSQIDVSDTRHLGFSISNPITLVTIEQVSEVYETSSGNGSVKPQHLCNDQQLGNESDSTELKFALVEPIGKSIKETNAIEISNPQEASVRNHAELDISRSVNVSVSSEQFRSLPFTETEPNHVKKPLLCISAPQKLVSIVPDSELSDIPDGLQQVDIQQDYPVPTIVNNEYFLEESSSDPLNFSDDTIDFFGASVRRNTDVKRRVRFASSVSSVIVIGSTQYSEDDLPSLIYESSSTPVDFEES